jgi:hypothetical protein
MADYMDSQPWWTQFIIKVGSWCALAMFLIAAMFGWLPTPMMQRLERMEYNAWQQTSILRAICYNMDIDDKNTKMNCDPWKIQGAP